MAGALEAARTLAQMGWPVLPVAPGAKQPLTSHGVQDATTDTNRLEAWWQRWPDANVGVACGHPGPQVLDIDDLQAAQDMLPKLEATGAPEVATPRGRHLYFAGNTSGTIALGYGELRGAGSYVVAPPSVHPSGKEYVWLVEPHLPLPKAPGDVAGDRKGKGAGVRLPVERVPHGNRHDHLYDLAIRLVRARMLDVAAIERALVAEYEAVCDKKPAAMPQYFRKIARSAAQSDIAERERAKVAGDAPVTDKTPARDAPLGELRKFVSWAIGLPDVIRVDEVVRFGNRVVDPLHIKLSNGMRIVFDEQREITLLRTWQTTITAALSGIAKPPTMKQTKLQDVFWSLCTIAASTEEQREEDDLQQTVDDIVELTEVVRGTFDEVEPRYRLLGTISERPIYDPREQALARQPVLIVDTRDGRRYLRAAELMAFARYRGLGISTRAFAGRMGTIGVWRRTIQAHGSDGHRRHTLYELPPEPAAA